MRSDLNQSLKEALRTSLVSTILTVTFMYIFYYPGWESIAAGICIGGSLPIILTYFYAFIQQKYFIRLNLLVQLLINTVVHVVIIFSVAVFFVVIFYMQGNFQYLFDNLSILVNRYYLIGLAFGLFLTLIFNFFGILNTLVGRNALGKFFLGMYRKPRKVERVFMFLDIRSSTTIAETIGPLKFMSLVNDFFYDITRPVYLTKGEIYKYVGDEAIITWSMANALKNKNCLRCYEMIQKAIANRSEEYNKKYGLVPEFKAGLHGGIVITGELGFNKREIAYMGDVLNTTSRIEEACKTLNHSLLISEDLVLLLNGKNKHRFHEVGNVKLRGKQNEIKLFTLQE
jgi:adenylate cyclase